MTLYFFDDTVRDIVSESLIKGYPLRESQKEKFKRIVNEKCCDFQEIALVKPAHKDGNFDIFISILRGGKYCTTTLSCLPFADNREASFQEEADYDPIHIFEGNRLLFRCNPLDEMLRNREEKILGFHQSFSSFMASADNSNHLMMKEKWQGFKNAERAHILSSMDKKLLNLYKRLCLKDEVAFSFPFQQNGHWYGYASVLESLVQAQGEMLIFKLYPQSYASAPYFETAEEMNAWRSAVAPFLKRLQNIEGFSSVGMYEDYIPSYSDGKRKALTCAIDAEGAELIDIYYAVKNALDSIMCA